VEKELIFLNDFEFDEATEKQFLSWGYLKNLMEENISIPVAQPKNAGANIDWEEDTPILGTAPQKIELHRKGKKIVKECTQMDNRVSYFEATYVIPKEDLRDCKLCPACTGRVWMEGAPGATIRPASPLRNGRSSASSRPAKRSRVGDLITGLRQLAQLRNEDVITFEEFQQLKGAALPPAPLGELISRLRELAQLRSEDVIALGEFQELKKAAIEEAAADAS